MTQNRYGRGLISFLLVLIFFFSSAPALAESKVEELIYYEGDGIFQAGSFSGPQEYSAFDESASPFMLRNARSTPSEQLYQDILAALAAENTINIQYTQSGHTYSSAAVEVDLDGRGFVADTSGMDNVYYLYAKAINSNPRYFYYIPNVVYAQSDGQLTMLYMLVNQAIFNDRELYRNERAAMLREAVPDASGMCESEIALAIHDYLCSHARYYYEAAYSLTPYELYPNSFSAYGAIIDKRAVCHGLSLAYMDMLSQFGISSMIVPAYALGHAWNLVCADGKWYHVDITLDSPTDFGDPDNDRHLFGVVKHDFFMLSDSEIRSDYNHSTWTADGLPLAQESHANRAFWNGISSTMTYIGGRWYYNDGIYDAAQKRSVGALSSSPFGSLRAPSVHYQNVSFPARLRNELYFFDYLDNTLYIYSPASNLRRARMLSAGEVMGEMEFGSLYPASMTKAVSDGLLYYVSSQGISKVFYAKDDLGDVEGDGAFNVLDVLKLNQYISNFLIPDEPSRKRADVNWDDLLTDADTRRICEYIVRLREGI